MLTKTARSTREAGEDALAQAKAKGLSIAADKLPRLAVVAEKAGHSIAEASTAAGNSIANASTAAGKAAATKLRALTPSSATRVAAFVAASRTAGPIWRFAKRRPVLLVLGGVAIAQGARMLWKSYANREEAEKSEEAGASV